MPPDLKRRRIGRMTGGARRQGREEGRQGVRARRRFREELCCRYFIDPSAFDVCQCTIGVCRTFEYLFAATSQDCSVRDVDKTSATVFLCAFLSKLHFVLPSDHNILENVSQLHPRRFRDRRLVEFKSSHREREECRQPSPPYFTFVLVVVSRGSLSSKSVFQPRLFLFAGQE